MKREDLKGLELSDEAIDKIMDLHGKDIEKQKTALETAQADNKTMTEQLTEANKAIEGFKALKPDELKAAADDWKAKFEQSQTDHATQLLKLEEDGALDKLLTETHKVADLIAIKAHLNREAIKYEPKSKSFAGLDEQVKPLKEQHGAYFSDYKKPPEIVTGGNNQSILSDKVIAAAREGARLPNPQGK